MDHVGTVTWSRRCPRQMMPSLFYGNSAMEFRQSMERLESAFIQESCFELISNGNLVPDANGVYPENTFNEAEPIEPDYDAEILERYDIIRTSAERMIQYIQQPAHNIRCDTASIRSYKRVEAAKYHGICRNSFDLLLAWRYRLHEFHYSLHGVRWRGLGAIESILS